VRSPAGAHRLLPALALALVTVTLAPRHVPPATLLYAEGVQVAADGRLRNIESGGDPSRAAPLFAGDVPGQGTRWEPMARRAMGDLDLLTRPTDLDGDLASPESAVLAGWHRSWRYVWPRDASFAVAALAVSGRHADALSVLRFLQEVQSDDGTWQARYSRDGTVPDDRGTQLDSVGWVLWGTWVWAETARAQGTSEDDVTRDLRQVAPMLLAAVEAAAGSVDPGHALPYPSPDFWEVPLRETSLGTAAPVLVGLRAATPLLQRLDEHEAADRVRQVERLLTDGIDAQFGRRGYPRLPSTRQMDASVTFLMPPFTTSPPGQAEAWRRARQELATPVGGLRPGVEFKDPEVSWTPHTALFALTAAASGDDDTAAGYLDWLDAHRTAVGSLPEKVDATGRPAAVAPLTWTGCLVLMTLAALDGDLPEPPAAPAVLDD
jgi:hypothetical protein